MLLSFGWFFAGGIVVFLRGGGSLLFSFTPKKQINQKKKAKCRMWAGTTSMTAKNHEGRAWGRAKKTGGMPLNNL
jgi:hypothetical protein